MAVRHKRYVNIYRAGKSGSGFDRAKYMQDYNQKAREDMGYPECKGCGKRFKDPSRDHYADFKNKIRCLDNGVLDD